MPEIHRHPQWDDPTVLEEHGSSRTLPGSHYHTGEGCSCRKDVRDRQFQMLALITANPAITLAALQQELGLPRSTVRYHVERLELLGYIERRQRHCNGYRVLVGATVLSFVPTVALPVIS